MRYTVFRYLPSFLTVLRYWVPPQCPPRLSLMQYSLSIFFGFGWRITTFIWWICTGKNSLHSSRVQECTLYFILFMLSFGAVISYYLLLFRPIATLQVAEIKNLLNFYSFPVALGQIYFVLVLISTAHNAPYLYIQKWISPGLQNVLWLFIARELCKTPLWVVKGKSKSKWNTNNWVEL